MPTCQSASRSLLAFFLLAFILLSAANLSSPHDVSSCCTRRFSLPFAYTASQHLFALPETQTGCCKTPELASVSDWGRLNAGSKLGGKLGLEQEAVRSSAKLFFTWKQSSTG